MVPTVSVIITCYNDAQYISDAINSIVYSSYCDWECIVIDDGSIDNSYDIINKYCMVEPRITYIYQKNSGVCCARNNAINVSKGKYILCLDADDYVSEKYIELCVKELDKNDKIKVVTTNYKQFGEVDRIIELEPYSIDALMNRNLFINCSMFRRKDFNDVGGFNLNMKLGLEDWDFWLSILERGGDVKYVEGIHFFYRIKKNNKSRNYSAKKNITYLKAQIIKNHYRTYSKNSFAIDYLSIVSSKEYSIVKNILQPIRLVYNKIIKSDYKI